MTTELRRPMSIELLRARYEKSLATRELLMNKIRNRNATIKKLRKENALLKAASKKVMEATRAIKALDAVSEK